MSGFLITEATAGPDQPQRVVKNGIVQLGSAQFSSPEPEVLEKAVEGEEPEEQEDLGGGADDEPDPQEKEAKDAETKDPPQMALSMSEKGWIGVDLDGTLAKYDGFKGHEHIGEPVPGMKDRVQGWLDNGEDVRIMTARVAPGGTSDIEVKRDPIQAWCKKHFGRELPVTHEKDQNMRELWDDRAVQVKPNTGQRVDGLEKSGIDELMEFAKGGGPFIGPRGGKWADPKHTIPWKEGSKTRDTARMEAAGAISLGKVRQLEERGLTVKHKDDLSPADKVDPDRGIGPITLGHAKALEAKGLVVVKKSMSGTEEIEAFAKSNIENMEDIMDESGKSVLDEYLEKAGTHGGMPSGEPSMGGSGEEQGGTVAGVGKTSGSNDSAPGEAIGAPAPSQDKLSEDDEVDENQLKPHKKPIENTAKSLGGMVGRLSVGEDDLNVSRQNAALASQMRKGEADLTLGVGIAPPKAEPIRPPPQGRTWNQGKDSRVNYSESSDLAASELAKGGQFYQQGEPTLSPTVSLTMARQCPACATNFSKSLTACPACGAGSVQHQILPGVIMEKSEGSEVKQSPRGPLLRKARGVQDLYLPNGVVKASE